MSEINGGKIMILVTDSGADLLEEEAKEMGLQLVPITASFKEMQFTANSKESFEHFYRELERREELPISSQPSPSDYTKIYEMASKKDEEVLVITISSKLSGTYNCAQLAKEIVGYEKVYIVDSLQASTSQRLLVLYAIRLIQGGKDIAMIVHELERVRHKIVLTGMPETLLYLKKGGRISPVIAGIGETLNIKPILLLEDGMIVSRKKVRGSKAGIKEMQHIISDYRIDERMPVLFGHSNNEEKGEAFMKEIMSSLPQTKGELYAVGPAIGTHIGPNALLMAFMIV